MPLFSHIVSGCAEGRTRVVVLSVMRIRGVARLPCGRGPTCGGRRNRRELRRVPQERADRREAGLPPRYAPARGWTGSERTALCAFHPLLQLSDVADRAGFHCRSTYARSRAWRGAPRCRPTAPPPRQSRLGPRHAARQHLLGIAREVQRGEERMQSLPAARPNADPVEQPRRLPLVQQTASVDRTGRLRCEVPRLRNRIGQQNASDDRVPHRQMQDPSMSLHGRGRHPSAVQQRSRYLQLPAARPGRSADQSRHPWSECAVVPSRVPRPCHPGHRRGGRY